MGAWSYAALWMTGIHSVPGYVFVVSLVALGHGIVTDLVGTALGAAVLAALYCATGLTGLRACPTGARAGLTFLDTIEQAYGRAAARFAAAVQGVVAVGWYGVQTYLAAVMVAACLDSLVAAPGGPAPAPTTVLGMTVLQWVVFVVLSVAQVLLLMSGEAVHRLAGLAGPAGRPRPWR